MTGNKNLTPFVKGNQYGKANKHQNALDHLAYQGALLGQTNEEIAAMLQISVSTFYLWKKTIPAFSEAVQRGRDKADAEVAESLFRRAVGRTISKEVHIELKDVDPITNQPIERIETVVLREEIPGDVRAQTQWLANRRRKQWAPPQRGVPVADTSVTVDINETNIVEQQTKDLEAIFGDVFQISPTDKPKRSH